MRDTNIYSGFDGGAAILIGFTFKSLEPVFI